MEPILKFSISNQRIYRDDNFYVVAGSKNYLKASFEFKTPEWDGKTKTAVFYADKPYSVVLVNDTCEVPWEFTAEHGDKYISVFAGDLITANKAKVEVCESGYKEGETPEPPTPSAYEQFVSLVEEIGDKASKSASQAEQSAVSASDSSARAVAAADAAAQSQEHASKSASNAGISEANAKKSENAAGIAASEIVAYREQIKTNKRDIDELKSDLDELNGNFIEPINKLDISACTENTIINLSTGEEETLTHKITSGYIEVKKGETYTASHLYDYYGNGLKFPIYDKNRNFLKSITPTNVDTTNNIATFTSDVDGYTRVVFQEYNYTPMFVAGTEYPSEYIPYSNRTHLADNIYINKSNVEAIDEAIDEAIVGLKIGEKFDVLVEKELTVLNDYIQISGSSASGAYHAEVSGIKSGEVYHIKAQTGSAVRTYVIKNIGGITTRYTDADSWTTNHDYDVVVTISDLEDGGTLVINTIDRNYIGLKLESKQFLIDGEKIKDDTIPTSKLKQVYNPLHQKTAIFDGDSICHGTSVGSTDPTYGYGWAGRIGINNNMTYKNFGISGGVITSASAFDVSGIHSVVDTIDTMYSQFPNADYIIFEGGTNDADRIGDARTTHPEKFGTFSMTDFSGNYDINTFTGALETIFYKATNYWKGKHIGYIVAQKMGYGSSAQYDATNSNRRYYFERAIEICKKWGIPYLDLWNGCYLVPTNPNMYTYGKTSAENIELGNLYTDGQHLTSKGYDYISPIIEEWMRGI